LVDVINNPSNRLKKKFIFVAGPVLPWTLFISLLVSI
jgi:hypothetical protein